MRRQALESCCRRRSAFLQGVELRRERWMSQPRSGIQGLDPRQIARIRKGVFGLSESPRMWYDRLTSVLLGEVFDVGGKRHRLVPSPLDPCVLLLLEEGLPGEPAAYLAMHVDDILLIAPTDVNKMLQTTHRGTVSHRCRRWTLVRCGSEPSAG